MPFTFHVTELAPVTIIEPSVFGDERGFFMETYKQSEFEAAGIVDKFIQDNHSRSSQGVLRGLHFQDQPYAQAKLVRVIQGTIFDVAVDIRKGSPSFGSWFGIELSAVNKKQLYIPAGFAHGFLTLSEQAEVVYKTSTEYSPEYDRAIAYNDPEIAITWPEIDKIQVSSKDAQAPILKDCNYNLGYIS